MPTPIGHSLAGAIIYTVTTRGRHLLKSWKWLVVCMLVAALADIDFGPALFGKLDVANEVHRSLTHTLLFAMGIWAAAFAVLRILRKPGSLRYSAVLLLCLVSHLFLDLLGQDSRPPVGIPLLWPFWERRFKLAVSVFPDLQKDTYAEVFSLYNAGVVGYEVLVFGSVLLLLILIKVGYGLRKRKLEKCGSAPGVAPDESR